LAADRRNLHLSRWGAGQRQHRPLRRTAGDGGAGHPLLRIDADVYVDVPPALGLERGWFLPYIGAGFGPSFNHADSTIVVGNLPGGFGGASLASNTTTDLSWNAGGGLAIRLFPGVATDLGYRYVDLGGFRTGSGVTSPTPATVDALGFRVRLHEIYLGVRVMFD
jgi:opacity protein-like surface antigen